MRTLRTYIRRALIVLFERAAEVLFPLRETEKVVATIQKEDLLPLYQPRSFIPDSAARNISIHALLPYAKNVQPLVLEAKFHNNQRAHELLGFVLAHHLQILAQKTHLSFCLVPIPLGKRRFKERGYNQVEEIARKALALMPETQLASSLLVRTRETLPQTSLGRKERKENMQNAFMLSADSLRALDAHTLFIILDDVTTTGATLLAACMALERTGAKNIVGIALAH